MSAVKKTLAFVSGFAVAALITFGSYKLGAHRQAVADDKEFTEYLGFVEKQDAIECKDAIGEAVNIMNDKCVHQMAEACPETKTQDFDPLDPF